MAGYLAHYGAGEEQREKLIRRLVVSLILLAISGALLYFFLKNYRQEQQGARFFQLLDKHDYKAAYTLWGCSEDKPCRDYPYKTFMEDWGPESSRANINSFHIRKSRACGSGVILTVDFGKNQEEKLWVERDGLTISFSPWPGCPSGR
jgi:hypothetical protein